MKPYSPDSSQTTQLALGHVEDITSSSYWNTPFCVQVNFHGQALEVTLDTGASVSAMRADVSKFVPGGTFKTTACVHLLCSFLMGECAIGYSLVTVWVYGPTLLPSLCSHPKSFKPLVLGMDFVMRASVVIQVPSRTVVLGDVPEADVKYSNTNNNYIYVCIIDKNNMISCF